jgi:FixJ family two-component response regulator
MPDFSGRAVLKEMKAKKINTPVVVLSAVALPKLIADELARDFPSVLFIPKTLMYSQLLPAIKRLIGK